MHKPSKLKLILTALAVTLLLFSCVLKARAADGVIDSQRVFNSYTAYQNAVGQYNATVEQARKSANKLILAEKDAAKRAQIQELYGKFCQQQQQRLLVPLQEHTKAVVAQVAREKGLSHVYEMSAKPDAGMNITGEVIAILNGISSQSESGSARRISQKTAATADHQSAAKAMKNEKPAASRQPNSGTTEQRNNGTAEQRMTDDERRIANNETTGQPKFIVQFCAGYNKGAIEAAVARAKNKGIDTAYVAEASGKNGITLWRARAAADTQAQAKEIAARLRKAGFSCFVVR